MSEPLIIPEWVCTLVGKLVLDNEALRKELTILKSDEKNSLIE